MICLGLDLLLVSFQGVLFEKNTMFLKDKQTNDLIEILDIEALYNPNANSVYGQVQAGQEEQEPACFDKETLKFPSGEELPRCWMDADYQKA
jgi:hypothetical protein